MTAAGFVVTDPATGQPLATWPNALPPRLSPCRPDPAKGVRQHRCSRWHAQVVEGFRSWAQSVEQEAEATAIGYRTELDEFWQARGGHPTLREYLAGYRHQERAA